MYCTSSQVLGVLYLMPGIDCTALVLAVPGHCTGSQVMATVLVYCTTVPGTGCIVLATRYFVYLTGSQVLYTVLYTASLADTLVV